MTHLVGIPSVCQGHFNIIFCRCNDEGYCEVQSRDNDGVKRKQRSALKRIIADDLAMEQRKEVRDALHVSIVIDL